MPKSLQDYLSKIKKATRNNQSPPSNSIAASKNWILSGCRHPKTLSFAVDRNNNTTTNNKNDVAATLLDIDRFLCENFQSLYLKEEQELREEEARDKSPTGILFESPRFTETPPDLCGSHRFFVTPAVCGSLIEEARNSLTAAAANSEARTSTSSSITLNDNSCAGVCSNDSKNVMLPDSCIAVLKTSQNPYDDFRCSMQEMVEARVSQDDQAKNIDWDFMEELLFSYLSLNEKKSYKFILGAFVDLITSLRQNSNKKTPARSPNSFRVARDQRRRRRRKN